jgi:dTDP-4-amino-4,6-dideoxygalactose transaminase
MKKYKIPFNKPCVTGMEMTYIDQAIRSSHISGDGEFTKKSQKLIEEILSVEKVLLTTSCTHALEMAAILLDIRPGDEVIIPSFTFVSTANAFALRGAKIVFADIKKDTLNIDETTLHLLITSRTKAIVVVHYAGVACAMDEIMKISNKYNIKVIEDNAHGLFGKYKGEYLGSIGSMSTLSFHETKNITSGEGGALIINDSDYIKRAEIIREKGTNRSAYFRGEIDKYTWVDIGSSYLPSDILAAYLYGQLKSYKLIMRKRKDLWNNYYNKLYKWAESRNILLPFVPRECSQAYHMFYIIMPNDVARQALISFLKARNILSVFHYVPLHISPMGKSFNQIDTFAKCPISEKISNKILRLPLYYNMTIQDQNSVINSTMKFR